MRKTTFFIGLAVAALITAAPGAWAGDEAAGKIDPKTAFEKLKTLAGEWTGTADENMPGGVIYRVTGNGSVVMETMFPGTNHEMINMYHMVDGELVATHYCSSGNQPHFKFDAAKSTPTELVFAFNGGTNLDPAKDSYVRGAKISIGDGKLVEDWTFYGGGKETGTATFKLGRK
ncbi:MAG TPA: hypothetical protein VF789_01580 [Thermoanaerobaculia bacterium]